MVALGHETTSTDGDDDDGGGGVESPSQPSPSAVLALLLWQRRVILWWRAAWRPTASAVLVAVLVASLYRAFVVTHASTGTFALWNARRDCLSERVLKNGHWFNDTKQWHLDSCVMRPFFQRPSDLDACVKGHTFVFIGDSRIRNLFAALVRKYDPAFEISIEHRHQHLSFSQAGVHLRFLWMPADGDTVEHGEEERTGAAAYLEAKLQELKSDDIPLQPFSIVYSAGLWPIKQEHDSALIGHTIHDALRAMLAFVVRENARSPTGNGHVYWIPIGRVDESRLWEARRTITNRAIASVNAHVQSDAKSSLLLRNPYLVVAHLSSIDPDFFLVDDGVHYHRFVHDAQANMLLNHVCRREAVPKRHLVEMEEEEHAPTPLSIGRFCCDSFPGPSMLQAGVLLFLFLLSMVCFGVACSAFLLSTKQEQLIREDQQSKIHAACRQWPFSWLAAIAMLPHTLWNHLSATDGACRSKMPQASLSAVTLGVPDEDKRSVPGQPTPEISASHQQLPLSFPEGVSTAGAAAQQLTLPKKSAAMIQLSKRLLAHRQPVLAAGIISTVLLLIYLADRTNLFMVTEKEFTWQRFVMGVLLTAALGAMTSHLIPEKRMSHAPPSTSRHRHHSSNADNTALILNRFQTSEWKGWMQLLILLYHYVAASKVLTIYVWIRVLVGAYIFLTGYGHYVYFSRKGDFSLARLAKVLFRVNVFTVLLCFVMDRSYQFYYFVPLSSFWFIMVYGVMWITRSFPPHLALLKPVLLSAITEAIWRLRVNGRLVLFQALFGWKLLAPLVEMDGSLHDWEFRGGLDRHAASMGMLVAEVLQICSRRSSLCNPRVRKLLGAVSVAAVIAYARFATTCSSKVSCNSYHVYLSPFLCVALVCIRNALPAWSSHYSTALAFFGDISLELFLGQYHLFLGADTKAVLVVVEGHPVLNVAVTGLIFVFLAALLAKAFKVLTEALFS